MTQESEYDKLVKKAKGIGIDLNIVMDEIDRRIDARQSAIARAIVDQIPSIKPDIEEIARLVAEKIQVSPVQAIDIDEIVSRILERIPDTGEAERKKILSEVAQQITAFLGNIDQRVEGMVRPIVEKALQDNMADMVQAVRNEMNKRLEEIASKVKEFGNGKGGGKWAQVPWEHVTPIIEKMVARGDQDPFAGIDQFIKLRERVLALEPQAPDVNQQFRSASASFLEGIKLGSKVTKGGIEPKKSSGLPGGPSVKPGKSITLHPAIRDL